MRTLRRHNKRLETVFAYLQITEKIKGIASFCLISLDVLFQFFTWFSVFEFLKHCIDIKKMRPISKKAKTPSTILFIAFIKFAKTRAAKEEKDI